jgi:GTP diphosphokinase / guanosine-3',5'-bis(diphosphate) 3'-diphosphatase
MMSVGFFMSKENFFMNPDQAKPVNSGIDAWLPTWAFAARVHANQTMPGSSHSYLQHLGAVTMEILSAHQTLSVDDLDLAVKCAMLHDTIEDQGVSYEELSNNFGPQVADGVMALTKRADFSKAEAMVDSLARIRQQPQAVWCVKMADRISNMSNIPAHWNEKKVEKYRLEAESILLALGDAHAHLAERLKQRITAISNVGC